MIANIKEEECIIVNVHTESDHTDFVAVFLETYFQYNNFLIFAPMLIYCKSLLGFYLASCILAIDEKRYNSPPIYWSA